MWFYKSNRGKKVEDGQINVGCESCSKCREYFWRQCRLEEEEICQKTSHQDLVTLWDRRIEQLLRNEILTAFPRDAIVGKSIRRRHIAPSR